MTIVLRLLIKSSENVAYNGHRKRFCVNPGDKDTTMSVFTKGNMSLVLIGIFMSGWSISLHASEKLPLVIDGACKLFKDLVATGHVKEKSSQEIEAENPTKQTEKLVFKPAVSDWKFDQLSISDHSGSTITEAQATPPCNSISIRSLVKTTNGDPAIASF